MTFAKLLGDASVLVESLGSLESEALRQFRSLMRDHIAAVQGDFHQHTGTDLGPPDFLHEALKQLMDIMKTYDASLASTGSREADFQPVLAEALDPFLAGCRNMSGGISAPGDSIFLANCLLATKTLLGHFAFTEGRVREVQAEMDSHTQALAEYQYHFLCRESGLDQIFGALRGLADNKEDIRKLAGIGPLQPPALLQTSQRLDDFLPSALMDAMENINQLRTQAWSEARRKKQWRDSARTLSM